MQQYEKNFLPLETAFSLLKTLTLKEQYVILHLLILQQRRRL